MAKKKKKKDKFNVKGLDYSKGFKSKKKRTF